MSDAVVPAFMSDTPRPNTLPSATSPLKGSRSQPLRSPTGNVSRWPLRISERPSPRSAAVSTFTIPGCGSITSTAWPWRLRYSTTQSAAARVSPGGFSLGRRTRSVSRRSHSSWRSSICLRIWSRASMGSPGLAILVSAPLPVRLPLLREGTRALHGVLRAPQPLRLRVVELERDVEGMPESRQRGLLAGADGERRALQDLVGPLQRRGHELGARHHLVDHAQAVSLLGRHVTAGEDVAHGDLVRDHAGQAMDATGAGHEAHAGLGQAEAGGVGGDDDVAGQRHLETAAERVAVDGGDDGLPVGRAVGEAAEAALGHAYHVAAMLGGEAQVVACGEGLVAGAGEDAHPQIGIALEVVPDPVELEVGGRVERVHALGPVDGDDGDAPLLLVGGELVGHGDHRPLKTGLRFSTKAAADSRKSSVRCRPRPWV